MRGLFFLLGIVVLVGAALLLTGIVSIDQTRPAVVQAPQFKAVTVPTVDVRKPQ